MAVFESFPKFEEFERVAFFTEKGFTAIIALHSSKLGPAIGGCRISSYPSVESALFDVLRLSEGMSYKNSVAGLDCGGGKSVIIADRNLKEGRKALFQRFGEWVNTFEGLYYTAEDMGTSVSDLDEVATKSQYVVGRSNVSGDPSPFTAKGVFLGIKACVKRVFQREDLQGLRIAIQGIGHVGSYLAEHLVGEGAKLILTDPSADVLATFQSKFGSESVALNSIYDVECDVFSPCAIGGILSSETIPRLKCKLIAGAANNQLLTPNDGLLLAKRGIAYAPDFVINAGGVINCAGELQPNGYSETWVTNKVEQIPHTLDAIFERSTKEFKLPVNIALELAKARINKK